MSKVSDLFDSNRRWAAKKVDEDPEFFERLVGQQTPKYLWIGCSDSRVSATQITGLNPGEIFVHRNVANVVVQTDLNMLSVVQYAVDVLQVEHIIVCGHYGCGGVAAALGNSRYGLIDNWLRNIQSVIQSSRDELEGLSGIEKENRLCELNVITQAQNLSRTTVLQDAWLRNQNVEVHSWIYGLNNGLLSNLIDPIRTVECITSLDK